MKLLVSSSWIAMLASIYNQQRKSEKVQSPEKITSSHMSGSIYVVVPILQKPNSNSKTKLHLI